MSVVDKFCANLETVIGQDSSYTADDFHLKLMEKLNGINGTSEKGNKVISPSSTMNDNLSAGNTFLLNFDSISENKNSINFDTVTPHETSQRGGGIEFIETHLQQNFESLNKKYQKLRQLAVEESEKRNTIAQEQQKEIINDILLSSQNMKNSFAQAAQETEVEMAKFLEEQKLKDEQKLSLNKTSPDDYENDYDGGYYYYYNDYDSGYTYSPSLSEAEESRAENKESKKQENESFRTDNEPSVCYGINKAPLVEKQRILRKGSQTDVVSDDCTEKKRVNVTNNVEINEKSSFLDTLIPDVKLTQSTRIKKSVESEENIMAVNNALSSSVINKPNTTQDIMLSNISESSTIAQAKHRSNNYYHNNTKSSSNYDDFGDLLMNGNISAESEENNTNIVIVPNKIARESKLTKNVLSLSRNNSEVDISENQVETHIKKSDSQRVYVKKHLSDSNESKKIQSISTSTSNYDSQNNTPKGDYSSTQIDINKQEERNLNEASENDKESSEEKEDCVTDIENILLLKAISVTASPKAKTDTQNFQTKRRRRKSQTSQISELSSIPSSIMSVPQKLQTIENNSNNIETMEAERIPSPIIREIPQKNIECPSSLMGNSNNCENNIEEEKNEKQSKKRRHKHRNRGEKSDKLSEYSSSKNTPSNEEIINIKASNSLALSAEEESLNDSHSNDSFGNNYGTNNLIENSNTTFEVYRQRPSIITEIDSINDREGNSLSSSYSIEASNEKINSDIKSEINREDESLTNVKLIDIYPHLLIILMSKYPSIQNKTYTKEELVKISPLTTISPEENKALKKLVNQSASDVEVFYNQSTSEIIVKITVIVKICKEKYKEEEFQIRCPLSTYIQFNETKDKTQDKILEMLREKVLMLEMIATKLCDSSIPETEINKLVQKKNEMVDEILSEISLLFVPHYSAEIKNWRKQQNQNTSDTKISSSSNSSYSYSDEFDLHEESSFIKKKNTQPSKKYIPFAEQIEKKINQRSDSIESKSIKNTSKSLPIIKKYSFSASYNSIPNQVAKNASASIQTLTKKPNVKPTGELAVRKMTYNTLIKTIDDMFTKRFSMYECSQTGSFIPTIDPSMTLNNNQPQSVVSFAVFMNNWLSEKHGLDSLIRRGAKEMLLAIKMYESTSPHARIVKKILRGEINEQCLFFILFVRNALIPVCKTERKKVVVQSFDIKMGKNEEFLNTTTTPKSENGLPVFENCLIDVKTLALPKNKAILSNAIYRMMPGVAGAASKIVNLLEKPSTCIFYPITTKKPNGASITNKKVIGPNSSELYEAELYSILEWLVDYYKQYLEVINKQKSSSLTFSQDLTSSTFSMGSEINSLIESNSEPNGNYLSNQTDSQKSNEITEIYSGSDADYRSTEVNANTTQEITDEESSRNQSYANEEEEASLYFPQFVWAKNKIIEKCRKGLELNKELDILRQIIEMADSLNCDISNQVVSKLLEMYNQCDESDSLGELLYEINIYINVFFSFRKNNTEFDIDKLIIFGYNLLTAANNYKEILKGFPLDFSIPENEIDYENELNISDMMEFGLNILIAGYYNEKPIVNDLLKDKEHLAQIYSLVKEEVIDYENNITNQKKIWDKKIMSISILTEHMLCRSHHYYSLVKRINLESAHKEEHNTSVTTDDNILNGANNKIKINEENSEEEEYYEADNDNNTKNENGILNVDINELNDLIKNRLLQNI